MVAPPGTERHAFYGHVGHLTQEQENILATFKGNLSGAGLYQPPTDTLKASHDDTTLL